MTKPCSTCNDTCEDATGAACQDCCEHNEHDHGECLDCGKDVMDRLIMQADAWEGER